MTYQPSKESFKTNKQIAQYQMEATAVSVYAPATNVETHIQTITIANTTTVNKWFSLWIDDDGSTYDDSTIMFHEVDVEPNTTLLLEVDIYMNNKLGNLAVQAETVNNLTITLFGSETDVS